LLEETDDQGNALVDYMYLGASPVATISPATAQIYFLHDDRLGTPQAGTDANQNSVWTASYGPFGEMSTVPSLIVQNLRLPGQEFDIDSGFYHNGFRDYSPAWGRYIESDPVGLAGGINTYSYAMANPVKLTDPFGLLTTQDFVATVRSIGQTVENGVDYVEGQAGSALNNLVTQLFELKYNGQEGYLLTHCPAKALPVLEALLGAKKFKDVWDELKDLSESELKRWAWALTIGGELEKQWENETNQQIQQQNRPNGGLYLPPPNPSPHSTPSPTPWLH
jgi:RHS repeat-associated protein